MTIYDDIKDLIPNKYDMNVVSVCYIERVGTFSSGHAFKRLSHGWSSELYRGEVQI